ncbi:hypothetical protein AAFF_G00266130 [Aldrovandia affinis]|uniref:Uncharacterized protein n=1 Tax=Aldrovandia affinis TaxID=143900 RepID=A0AAD7W308_9TELE|nr:hypothetical protein AAFF_G00266130 [Aldrovandia affinis]
MSKRGGPRRAAPERPVLSSLAALERLSAGGTHYPALVPSSSWVRMYRICMNVERGGVLSSTFNSSSSYCPRGCWVAAAANIPAGGKKNSFPRAGGFKQPTAERMPYELQVVSPMKSLPRNEVPTASAELGLLT